MSKDIDDSPDLKQAMFAVSDAVLGAAVLLALGVYGGGFLDSKLHTAPWLSVGLALLGGGLGLARMVMKANALDSKKGKAEASVLSEKLSADNSDTQKALSEKPVKAPEIFDEKKQRMPYDSFSDDN